MRLPGDSAGGRGFLWGRNQLGFEVHAQGLGRAAAVLGGGGQGLAGAQVTLQPGICFAHQGVSDLAGGGAVPAVTSIGRRTCGAGRCPAAMR